MNLDNFTHLDGTVRGECWTRWPVGKPGQVRFWLAVSRGFAGEGVDLFLCAVQPKSVTEITALERELRDGRHVRLHAEARQVGDAGCEDRPGVVFVAEECGFDGGDPRNAHTIHKRAHGKCAAAGDVDGAEATELALSLEEAKS